MSKALTIQDELFGFYPGNQGSTVVIFEKDSETVTINAQYAVPFEDDADGWDWGLGGTRLNVLDVTNLRDFLNEVLEGWAK